MLLVLAVQQAKQEQQTTSTLKPHKSVLLDSDSMHAHTPSNQILEEKTEEKYRSTKYTH